MRTKSKIIYDFSCQCEYDVIVLVETWLNADFADAEFFDLKLFNVYRKDRSEVLTGCSRGGGVLIAVKCEYKSSLYNIDNKHGLLDQLFVSICNSNFLFYVCASYIPPGCADDMYEAHIANILALDEEMAANSRICVLGDFNLNDIFWSQIGDSTELLPSKVNKSKEINFIDSLLSLNLVQINHISNQLNRFLDLIFVPDDCKFSIHECLMPISPSNVHHTSLLIEIDSYNFFKYSESQISINFNFNHCNFDVINSLISSVVWMPIFSCEVTSSCYEKFLNTVLGIFRKNIPFKKAKPYKLPWYTPGLKKLKNLRNKFHKHFLDSGSLDSHAKFIHYQREFNFLNKFLYKQFILQKEGQIKMNPKSFWSYVKSKKQVSDIPSTMVYGDRVSESCSDAANMFAHFFSSNFESPTIHAARYSNVFDMLDIGILEVSEDDVYNAIMQIKNNLKSDSDGLCAYLLKKCAPSISFALSYIFNLSLNQGVFIDKWKSACITPIFKNGRKDDVTSYRPISKLSCVSKVFEHVMYKKLFFLTKSLISPFQHGFYAGRSTTTNLIVFSEYCLSTLELGKQVECIYTDFSKAFDKVSFNILYSKLQAMGFHSNVLMWIKSYLSNRMCKVVIEGFESVPYEQTSGVPQGSILGTLFFNLFVNDISNCFTKVNFLLYADDLKIYNKINDITDVMDLQNDLNHLHSWCLLNSFQLNLEKCHHLSFTRSRNAIPSIFKIGNYKLKTVESTIDLGVVFDATMSFIPHINYIIPKAYAMLAFIRRSCSDFSDPYTFCLLYSSYVRSKLEYAAVVWSPHCRTYISRIERVQNIFLKYALSSFKFVDPIPSYRSKGLLLGLETLEYRRRFQSALLVFNIINGNIDCHDLLSQLQFYVPPRILRHNYIFNIPCHRTNYAQNSTINRACTDINAINEIAITRGPNLLLEFSTSKDCFKLFLFRILNL